MSVISALAHLARMQYHHDVTEDQHNTAMEHVVRGRDHFDALRARVTELEREVERLRGVIKEAHEGITKCSSEHTIMAYDVCTCFCGAEDLLGENVEQ